MPADKWLTAGFRPGGAWRIVLCFVGVGSWAGRDLLRLGRFRIVTAWHGGYAERGSWFASASVQAALFRTAGAFFPQQRLYFVPEPHGQVAFRAVWADLQNELSDQASWVCA